MSFEKKLLKRLPEYEAEGLIDKQSALRLKQYLNLKISKNTLLFRTSLYFVGILLVFIGICLFVRNIWDLLTTTTHLVFAFIPLMISLGLGSFVLYKQLGTLMRELSGVVNFLATFAMFSIISTTLNIECNLYNFSLALICLSLPVVFIFRSVIISVVVLNLLMFVNSDYPADKYFDIFFNYTVLAGIGFFLFRKFYSEKPVLHIIACWIFCIIAPIIIGNSLGNFITHSFFGMCNNFAIPNELGMILATGSLSIMLLYSSTKTASKHLIWKNPFFLAGIAGIVITATQMNSSDFHTSFFCNAQELSNFYKISILDFIVAFTFVAIIFGIWIYLFVNVLKTSKNWSSIIGSLIFIIYSIDFFIGGNYLIYVVFANLLMFITALLFVCNGIKNKNYLFLNIGIVLLLSQAVIRMFVSELDMVFRASLFIVFGILLITTNWYVNSNRQRQK